MIRNFVDVKWQLDTFECTANMITSKREPIFAHVILHGFRWKFLTPSSSCTRNSVMKIAERWSLKILQSPNTTTHPTLLHRHGQHSHSYQCRPVRKMCYIPYKMHHLLLCLTTSALAMLWSSLNRIVARISSLEGAWLELVLRPDKLV